ncbi:hypothetical protein [Sandarakinorhabdus sp. DWP1-3-1]|uniref:hypothetical protein n=1 Tax=Sandarakinorhabdus sp. DWP1-3-1 TaxID=2804627 RepID=UPI003CF35205
MRRIPLWLTLVPLVVGIAIYGWLWSGWAREFRATIEDWLPGATVSISGFPYRMEADVAAPRLAGGDVVRLTAAADRARINRGPWQPELTVIGTDRPRFSVTVGSLLSATIAGKSAASSVKVVSEGGATRLVRLSSVIEAATARLGFTPVAIAADSLELHLRERRDEVAIPGSPAGAPRGQLVLAGERLRFGTGDALTFAADMLVTGDTRLTGYDAWARSGTIELTSLTLSDASGEIASVKATLAPQGRTGLRVAGTITTVCPASIAAALAAAPSPSEKRLRAPVRLSFEGVAGAVTLGGLPADLATRPTRGQLPACPVIRR